MRLVLLAVALALALGFTPSGAQTPAPPAPLRTISVAVPNGTLKLEVADTFDAREYGLMFRTSVPAGTGMIFVFKSDGPETFWMKNTLVALDMVYVRADGTIDAIFAGVPASTTETPDDKVATRLGNGKYVIELGAGGAARAGLKPQLKLALPPLAARD